MKPRPIPRDLSFEALFLPNREHAYFDGAAEVPFERVAAFSAVDAWWLAELSLLAYVPDADFVRSAAGPDAELIERDGVACLVAGDLVAFRGTDEGKDVLRDLDVRLAREGAGRVHRGFRAALDLVWDDVEECLEGREAWLTGHSMGAALAVIAATRRANTRAVYTFGSPRFCDNAFAAGIGTPVHRVVNNNDVVTRVPLPGIYEHVGELQYIDSAGVVRTGPGLWERVREQLAGHGARIRENFARLREGDFRAIPYDSLVDHSPLHYAIHMWNHVAATERG